MASWTSGDMFVLEINDTEPELKDPLRGSAPPSANFEDGQGMCCHASAASGAILRGWRRGRSQLGRSDGRSAAMSRTVFCTDVGA